MKQSNNKYSNLGSTYIELLIYVGLLGIIIVLIYDLFIQSSILKVQALGDKELYLDSNKVITELNHAIRSASDISVPAFRSSGTALSLNGGTVIYALNDGRLQKNDNGEIDYLTGNLTTIENLSFTQAGSSSAQPTVLIRFTISTDTVNGEKSENIQTAVTLR